MFLHLQLANVDLPSSEDEDDIIEKRKLKRLEILKKHQQDLKNGCVGKYNSILVKCE